MPNRSGLFDKHLSIESWFGVDILSGWFDDSYLRNTGGLMNYWNGSAWVPKPMKAWTGSVWKQGVLKFWNGSFWEKSYNEVILAGALDTTAFTAEDITVGTTSQAYVELNVDGTATLVGNVFTDPATPLWWTSIVPPPTWVSFSSTGNGTIIGGRTAGVRYQLNVVIQIGIEVDTFGSRGRTFTLSFYDAASGGTLLGTKTFQANVELT